ncbi:MAG: peptidoglycan-binding domain-containing protein, partial [Rivularia sp. (in: cyanobacteria)]
GIYGLYTEAAIQQFQRSNGLYADGIVGNLTWRKLIG